MADKALCKIDGCGKSAKGKGFCGPHYMRWWRHGDPLTNIVKEEKACGVTSCEDAYYAQGFCQKHYWRNKRNGSPQSHRTSPGDVLRWIEKNVSYRGDDCLKWPFPASDRKGYGRVQFRGKVWVASRVMCVLAHGEPPTPEHHAAHICGNGDEGCMNPCHLEWKTLIANEADKAIHGTMARGEAHGAAMLTEENVLEIRRLKGVMFQREIAEIFGVAKTTVGAIHSGRNWAWLK
jgi:hypothetical protein